MKRLKNGREGEDIPFGPPPIEYSYQCSRCQHEATVNEAIIDAEIDWAKIEGYHTPLL